MYNYIFLILGSIVLNFTLESLIYDNFHIGSKLIDKGKIAYLFNLFITFSLLIILSTIFKNLFSAYLLVFILYVFLGIINYQLKYYRNEYLKPIDFKLFSESIKISEDIETIIPNALYLNLVTNFIFSILMFNTKYKFSFIHIYIIIGFIVFVILIQHSFIIEKIFFIKLDNFSDFNNYYKNGFLFTFLSQLQAFKLKVPKNYKNGISDEFLKYVESSQPDKKPNIIIIMNESFFNINEVNNLKLSKNPLENFEKFKKEYTSGNVISPLIGGGTCQPEYEVLTGNSVFFTNKFRIAFIEFFKYTDKVFEGLPKVLKNLHYSSVFIHPFNKEFYNRDIVYSSLGFERILDIKDFENPTLTRNFISDLDCYEKLIFEYENKNRLRPFFAKVVTMQNHPGYLSGEKFDKHNIQVLNEDITKKEKIMLENYSNQLKESDNALKYLLDYFKEKNDTIILFFGDHQPSDNIGFSSITKRNNFELSKTPFLIWDNFNLEKRFYENISPSFLPSILLDMANIKSDKYFNYLFNKLDSIKAFGTEFIIDGSDKYYYRKDAPRECKYLLNQMELIQFDRINK